VGGVSVSLAAGGVASVASVVSASVAARSLSSFEASLSTFSSLS
jgi:hypothetical protein